jgi:enoyl-CoA hydratase/carnithine racemase
VITLRRERKLNALSAHMESELLRAVGDPAVASSRAIVVTGGETVFSAGADVTELREMTTKDIVEYYRGSGSVYEEFAALPQPTVAAISGYCLGGGLEFALAADIRIADPAAIFGFPEIDIGILPSSGGLTRIARAVGAGRARDLVLRGRRFDATQAEQWGIVSEISAAGEHVTHALAVARELSRHSAMALRITKQVLDVSLDAPREAVLLLEQLAYSVLNEASALSDSASEKPAV